MNIELTFEVFDDYLKIRLTGENPFSEIEEILTTIMRLAEDNKRNRVLIDAVDIPDVTDMEKYYLGTLGATMYRGKIKVALLRKQEHINKFTENVAVNRGGELYISSDESDALDWLMK